MNIWESVLVISTPVSIFHGVDPMLEMAEFLDVLERRIDKQKKHVNNVTKVQDTTGLRDILKELEYLRDIRNRKNTFDPVLKGIIDEKLSRFMQEIGLEAEKDNTNAGAGRKEELRRQIFYLSDLARGRQAGNPILQRLIFEKLKGYYSLRSLEEGDHMDNGKESENPSLDEIRDAKVLADDEIAILYYMAKKILGRDFDHSEPFPLEMVLAAENLRIHQKRVFFQIWFKASERIKEKLEHENQGQLPVTTAGQKAGDVENVGAEGKCNCGCRVEDGTAHARITHFKLIDFLRFTGITDAECSDFFELVREAKVAEDDKGFYCVDDILSSDSISVEQKDEFTRILRKMQSTGSNGVACVKPSCGNPSEDSSLSASEKFRKIIDSYGISNQNVSDLVRLMYKSKSAPGSSLEDVLQSGYLSADKKEEIRDIIDRALKGAAGARLKPGKITDAIPHSSDRKDKKYVMIITSEEPDYSGKSLIEYYSENPERGTLVDIVYGDNYEELTANGDYEGLFYLLYEVGSGKRLGYGCIGPDIMEELNGGEEDG